MGITPHACSALQMFSCVDGSMELNLIAGKFELTVPSVSFCGFIISRYGAVANLEKVRAIAEFHTPGNIIDPRCFFYGW